MKHVFKAWGAIGLVAVLFGWSVPAVLAAPAARTRGKAAEPPKEDADEFIGEYAGTFSSSKGKAVSGVAKVYGRRSGKGVSYRAALYAVESGQVEKTVIGPGTKVLFSAEVPGSVGGGGVRLKGKGWTGLVRGGRLLAAGRRGKFALSSVVRKSPTELAKPPAGAIVLLPVEAGKGPSLAEWTNRRWVPLRDGSVLVKGGDNCTKRPFSRFTLHLEFRIPTFARGGGNSGVYILDRYEIQVLDSFGHKPSKGGCAAVYQTHPPTVNASLPAGRWQTFDITFQGPKLEGGKCVRLPKVTVLHNGVTVQKDADVPNATGMARSKGHGEKGPIRLQDHGSPIRFRNIWIVEQQEESGPTR